jgi:transposase-like protein
MKDDELKPFESSVEMDETYVGGKPKRHPLKKGVDLSLLDSSEGYSIIESPEAPFGKMGRGTDKTPVFGIKERESGRVYAQIMLPDEAGKKLTGKQLFAIIEKRCVEGITVITDDFSSYKILDEPDFLKLLDDLEPSPRYDHKTVCHSSGEYVAPGGVHTNGIESFWALFKRGHHGTYHSMSVNYMQRYLDEFCFRQNTRKSPSLEVFDLLLKQSILKKHI